MAESSAKRSSIEQLLNKASPQHGPETEEAINSYQEGRSRSRPSLMLDLRLVDGTIESKRGRGLDSQKSCVYLLGLSLHFRHRCGKHKHFPRSDVKLSGARGLP